MFDLSLGLSLLLLLCLFCVCVFEFINGFHDTANAVATVIYTNTLPPTAAVVFSGILNGLGVLFGGTAVAVGIVSMLPVETLVDQSISHSLSMVAAILLTAIFWNFGTWYLGIPASSTHTLVGSILGCGIAYTLISKTGEAAVNWKKATDVGVSLIVSPLFGFLFALILMFSLRKLVSKDREMFKAPDGDFPPPIWIRLILILTCGLVSYSHGSNDGQKGIGLMMLVLIGIVPAHFALSHRFSNPDVVAKMEEIVHSYDEAILTQNGSAHAMAEVLGPQVNEVRALIDSVSTSGTNTLDRFEVRRHVLLIKDGLKKLSKKEEFKKLLVSDKSKHLNGEEKQVLDGYGKFNKHINEFHLVTDYAPFWVVLLVALSLGIGTMIGWKRIVVTIGEKIGRTHLTYAQGASAEIVAASTIAVSTYLGLPVSTTQVLSSGIAGTMYATGGQKNLRKGTISKILLAWVLTFPVCLTMSGTIFLLLRTVFP